MQEEISTVIAVAYTPEQYEKIFVVSEDKDGLEKNWEEWRRAADEKKAEATTQGVEYVEQYIDVFGLITYCLGRNILVNAQTRADYAHFLYEKQGKESVVSVGKTEEEEHLATLTHAYTPPVDKLLTYSIIDGEDSSLEISYVETFGFGAEEIPELICMATDDYLMREESDELEFYAPIHAMRALAELQAEEAIDPLLRLYDKASEDDNEWVLETLVYFYLFIGSAALPALEQFLADPLHDHSAQNYVAEIIGKMPMMHTEAREECVAVATRRLADFEVNHPELNECLIRALLRMEAVEAAPLIEAAFASGRVDNFWGVDWNEAQYELGLKERPAKQERSSLQSPPPLTPAQSTISASYVAVHTSKKNALASKKAKAKLVKASKKANRRKK